MDNLTVLNYFLLPIVKSFESLLELKFIIRLGVLTKLETRRICIYTGPMQSEVKILAWKLSASNFFVFISHTLVDVLESRACRCNLGKLISHCFYIVPSRKIALESTRIIYFVVTREKR